MKVKICGVKDIDTALFCAEQGADLIGFNFSPKSIREISLQKAVDIFEAFLQRNLFYSTKLVALFFHTPLEKINEIIKEIPFSFIQIVESDNTVNIQEFRTNVIQQIHVKEKITDSDLTTEFSILDSYSPEKGGGTGEKFNWNLISVLNKKFFLAGGLNPENVLEAIEKVNPYGVDVASGVESSKGIKDLEKIRKFIKNAKRI
jgi:phosphoribosylanthranilate isomerase